MLVVTRKLWDSMIVDRRWLVTVVDFWPEEQVLVIETSIDRALLSSEADQQIGKFMISVGKQVTILQNVQVRFISFERAVLTQDPPTFVTKFRLGFELPEDRELSRLEVHEMQREHDL